jgi:hypothetical protein
MIIKYDIIKDAKTKENQFHALLKDKEVGPWILRKSATFEVSIKQLLQVITSKLESENTDSYW